NAACKKPQAGVNEDETEFQLKEVENNEELLLFYRAWAKAGSEYLRTPQDGELKSISNTAKKQELYSFTKREKYTTGTPEICGQLCYSMTVEDLGAGLETAIVSEYEAKVSNTYKLHFTLTNNSSTTYSGVKLNIANENSGLELQNYKVKVKGQEQTGTVTNNLIELDVGSFAAKEPVSGELTFKTTKDGASKLVLELISGKEKIQPKAVLVKVSPAKKLLVDVVPKAIVPFIQNQVLVHVTDADDKAELSNAIVRLTLNDGIVTTGTTDSKGEFEFTLPAPSSNSKLTIEAEKNGYLTLTTVMNVTETILDLNPSSVTESLVVSGVNRRTLSFGLTNSTEIPLTVKKIAFTGEFTDLIQFDFKDNLLETDLTPKRDYNFLVEAALTQKGQNVSQPTKLLGSLDIEVYSEALKKSWVNRVPVELRITFGGNLDNADCLIVDPLSWNIFTTEEVKSLDVVVKNNCEVNGKKVDLQG
ncbi:MAG: carboxypeptidase-like regulatory domain-containing protein, partial [Candidatus Woesearchaeota archaeon]|nr:carboxypeptidase-like regulatory domain-containing protein [Candidatus Woesearchaeota archaeon]